MSSRGGLNLCALLLAAAALSAFTVHAETIFGGAGWALNHHNGRAVWSIGDDRINEWNPKTEFSVEFWAKHMMDFSTKDRIHTVVSLATPAYKKPDGSLGGTDDNYIGMSIAQTVVTATVSPISSGVDRTRELPADIPAGEWHHHALTFNNADGHCVWLMDGTESVFDVFVPELVNMPLNSDISAMIGQDQDGVYSGTDPGQSFVGYIDGVRFWDRELSAEDILAVMNFQDTSGLGVAGLEQAFHLNEGNGTTTAGTTMNGILAGIQDSSSCETNAELLDQMTPKWVPSDAPIFGAGFQIIQAPLDQSTTFTAEMSTDQDGTASFSVTSHTGCDYVEDGAGGALGATFTMTSGTSAVRATGAGSSCVLVGTLTVGADSMAGYRVLVVAHAPPAAPANDRKALAEEDSTQIVLSLAELDTTGKFTTVATVTTVPTSGVLYELNQAWDVVTPILNAPHVLSDNGAGVQYIPLPNQAGSPFDSFEYTVTTDLDVVSVTRAVSIDISALDDKPIASRNPYAVSFDGNDDHVAVEVTWSAFSNDVAVEFWVRLNPSAGANAGNLMTAAGGLSVDWQSEQDSIVVTLGSTEMSAFVNRTTTAWFHYHLQIVGTSMAHYINGVAAGSATAGAPFAPADGAVTFGLGFNGYLDEFSFFDDAARRTQDAPNGWLESRNVFGTTAGLVAVWAMNEGVGGVSACDCGGTYAALQLGGGNKAAYPFWRAAPTVIDEHYEGYPWFAVWRGDEDTAQVIHLTVKDVDSSAKVVHNFITRLPDHGVLYQYDADACASNQCRGDMLQEYEFWKFTQTPLEQWVSRVAAGPNNEAGASTADASLKFSTQYRSNKSYRMLDVIGAPEAYNPLIRSRGYGDCGCAHSPIVTGDQGPHGSRTCHTVPEGTTDANPAQHNCASDGTGCQQWSCPNDENDFMELGFDTPVYLQSVSVYENYYPGAVVVIHGRDANDGEWVKLYEGEPDLSGYDMSTGEYTRQTYEIFTPTVCHSAFLVDAIRLENAHHIVPGWNEIDAVQMVGTQARREGIVTDPEGRVVFVPHADYNGNDSFEYTPSDCSPVRAREGVARDVQLRVAAVNDPPVLQPPVVPQVEASVEAGVRAAAAANGFAGDLSSAAVAAYDLSFYDPEGSGSLRLLKAPAAGKLVYRSSLGATATGSDLDREWTVDAPIALGAATTAYIYYVQTACADGDSFRYALADSSGVQSAATAVTVSGTEVCDDSLPIYVIIIIVVVVLLVVLGVALFMYRRAQAAALAAKIAATTWKVQWDEFVVQTNAGRSSVSVFTTGTRTSGVGSVGKGRGSIEGTKGTFIRTGKLRGQVVAMKDLTDGVETCTVDERDQVLREELYERQHINHQNVVSFQGCCVEPGHVAIFYEYCAKGSLMDVLQNMHYALDDMFRFALATDLSGGMAFIHDTIGPHGNLSSSNCLVSGRWVLKISDFGVDKLVAAARASSGAYTQNVGKLLWTAPELVGADGQSRLQTKTQAADVYAGAIILHEILTREMPFESHMMDPNEVLMKVRGDASFRPQIPAKSEETKQFHHPELITLMQRGWAHDPAARGDFKSMNSVVKRINPRGNENVMDSMTKMLEDYANHLEDLVNQRTEELNEEKKKTEQLLYQMLPKSVADALKTGNAVKAETFESASIYFSDIVGFTKIAGGSTPLQVVDLLNDLYTCFDAVIDHHDVYKVETIGDAYMVASGLPLRNGNRHPGEIANMALDLLAATTTFKIRHMPETQLQLRAGMHTGPAVAGVVGLKMPRYCLFGDTVNTASRMESGGFALRIHMSNTAAKGLKELGGYKLDSRGEIEVKGKGRMETFWLTGRDGWDKELPDLARAAGKDEHEFK